MKVETILLSIFLEVSGCTEETGQEQIAAQQQPVCRHYYTKLQGQIIVCRETASPERH